MIRRQDISNWTYQDLKDFLNRFDTLENDFYEFKSTYKIEPERLRKLFSSFANSGGGYIFFGIDDYRSIMGLELDNSINTKINRAISNVCLQPPIDYWRLINMIQIPRTSPKKFVYIFFIENSLLLNKPQYLIIKYILGNKGSRSLLFQVEH